MTEGLDRHHDLATRADLHRIHAIQSLDPKKRSQKGQFFTPPPVGKLMASMFTNPATEVRLLDAGAGVGSLTAAFVDNLLERDTKPEALHVTAYEIEDRLAGYLQSTLDACESVCQAEGITFTADVRHEDFIQAATLMLQPGLFQTTRQSFNRIIMNPPYRKIRSDSKERAILRSVGVETGNLYSGFLALALQLLDSGGELVAITPRSFCNGPYFKPFRQLFLGSMALRRIHVFEARDKAFAADDVLQENIVFHAIKGGEPDTVLLTSSQSPDDELLTVRQVEYEKVVDPDDPDLIIHIATSQLDQHVLDRLVVFQHTLEDLGVAVSTGRVVDFRARQHLREDPDNNTVPLIYPGHFQRGYINWPTPGSKKPNAIVQCADTEKLLLPSGTYTLVKRFSAKEEPRRIVAALYDPHRTPASHVGFENHLNVYHSENEGLPENVAGGLAVYLNSSLVDIYFRQFNGHTQVNATDLRMLRYPSVDILAAMSKAVGNAFPSQKEIDDVVEDQIRALSETDSTDPVLAKRMIEEALEMIRALGLPRGQQNERSALALLALVGLKPGMDWPSANNPLMGITPIMDFARDYYGREYAPNTRETFRRQTVHQFLEAALVVANPDQPDRPPNSPKFCYQIEPEALQLIRTCYRTSSWQHGLTKYLAERPTLQDRYAQERKMQLVPVTLPDGTEVKLSAGNHSQLMKAIVEDFAPRYAPGGRVLYLDDTGEKSGSLFDRALKEIGVDLDAHGKMPDVVIHDEDNDWLFLIEAVTSHGPVDPKRRRELEQLFAGVELGPVYVTAFLTRSDLAKYLTEISWETEVWVSEAPTHLIHFDGERFLGPYDNE